MATTSTSFAAGCEEVASKEGAVFVAVAAAGAQNDAAKAAATSSFIEVGTPSAPAFPPAAFKAESWPSVSPLKSPKKVNAGPTRAHTRARQTHKHQRAVQNLYRPHNTGETTQSVFVQATTSKSNCWKHQSSAQIWWV
jgi:hypothetical protein